MAISATTAAVITAVSVAASVAGTVMSSMAQQQAAQRQAEQQEAANRYQQKIAERNRDLAEEQARAARKEGYDAATRKRQEVASIIGAQRARQGASGIATNTGSALDLNMDTAERGEIDALALQQQGLDKARNLEIQAWNSNQNAQGYAWAADNVSGGNNGLGMAGTILGGIGQAGSMFGSNMWGGGGGSSTVVGNMRSTSANGFNRPNGIASVTRW
ncbi:MAG: hypothetical protein K6F46_11655 [Desulfovibrio sp.]|nr:hypothetical protein [Desulfovibrio sp.]